VGEFSGESIPSRTDRPDKVELLGVRKAACR